MARLQEPILAGPVFHRCARPRSAPPLRRRLLRTVRNDHPGNCWRKLEVAGIDRKPVSSRGPWPRVAADWRSLKSPENYLGYQRTQNFASLGGAVLDKPRSYEVPARLRRNDWALSGDWTVQERGHRPEQAQRAHRLPLSRPRSSSCHGSADARNIRQISRTDRRSAAGCGPRTRRGRARRWQR